MTDKEFKTVSTNTTDYAKENITLGTWQLQKWIIIIHLHVRSIWLAQNYIENNTWMLGNVKFHLSVDQDTTQLIKRECMMRYHVQHESFSARLSYLL